MKKFSLLIALAASAFFSQSVMAQQHRQCGNARLEALYAARPGLKAQRDLSAAQSIQAGMTLDNSNTAAKGASVVTIPVVFHVVLSQDQLDAVGGTDGVSERCISQIAALNADYAGVNADSSQIPAAFKLLFGKTNIRFGLAHTNPTGHGTPGYDLRVVTVNGFDVNSNSAGGEVKHATDGGIDGWDNTKYLNVWVINFLDGTGPSGILGLTISPEFGAAIGFPASEFGIQVSYGAFGVRSGTLSAVNFYTNFGGGHHADLGRTLTHEIGHFFELRHTWGDDNGACPGDAGYADDGIADTPPSADANYGCPTFPLVSCTASSPNGDMFMDYMDYVDDICMHMFSSNQASEMNGRIVSTGESISLTQHPSLLTYPLAVNDVNAQTPGFSVSPNPAAGKVFISFGNEPQQLQGITIVNAIGQQITKISGDGRSVYGVDMANFARGVYYVQCRFTTGTASQKILLQ